MTKVMRMGLFIVGIVLFLAFVIIDLGTHAEIIRSGLPDALEKGHAMINIFAVFLAIIGTVLITMSMFRR